MLLKIFNNIKTRLGLIGTVNSKMSAGEKNKDRNILYSGEGGFLGYTDKALS